MIGLRARLALVVVVCAACGVVGVAAAGAATSGPVLSLSGPVCGGTLVSYTSGPCSPVSLTGSALAPASLCAQVADPATGALTGGPCVGGAGDVFGVLASADSFQLAGTICAYTGSPCRGVSLSSPAVSASGAPAFLLCTQIPGYTSSPCRTVSVALLASVLGLT